MNYKQFDFEQLVQGTKIELEHTDNIKIAIKIAGDHLAEVPDYYTKLKKHVEPEE